MRAMTSITVRIPMADIQPMLRNIKSRLVDAGIPYYDGVVHLDLILDFVDDVAVFEYTPPDA